MVKGGGGGGADCSAAALSKCCLAESGTDIFTAEGFQVTRIGAVKVPREAFSGAHERFLGGGRVPFKEKG